MLWLIPFTVNADEVFCIWKTNVHDKVWGIIQSKITELGIKPIPTPLADTNGVVKAYYFAFNNDQVKTKMTQAKVDILYTKFPPTSTNSLYIRLVPKASDKFDELRNKYLK